MSEINFIQVIEEIDEIFLGTQRQDSMWVLVGSKSRKLLGFKVVSTEKTRNIYFHDIDQMKKTMEKM